MTTQDSASSESTPQQNGGKQPESSYTPFRLAEKHFKNRSRPGVLPSLRTYNSLDLSRPEDVERDEVWKAGWWSPLNESGGKVRKGKERARGERPENDLERLRAIRLDNGRTGWVVAEGCILIPGYLDPQTQLDLLTASLSEYTRPPNPLSLSTHYQIPEDIFSLYASDSPELILPLHQLRSQDTPDPDAQRPTTPSNGRIGRRTIETEPGSVLGYDEILAKSKAWVGDVASDKAKAKPAGDLLREMRWANLGWVYKWTTKAYDFTTKDPIPFPHDLKKICREVVRQIPWAEVFEENCPEGVASWADDYEPDTGIVNFYQLNDTLMGHVDRAELDPSRPLVSISLGHTAVFLLGSASRYDPPRPVILRSGDVLIMSGRGRQFYHGVPRILEGTLPAIFEPKDGDDALTSAAKRYVSTARININARQVFPPGFKRPEDP